MKFSKEAMRDVFFLEQDQKYQETKFDDKI